MHTSRHSKNGFTLLELTIVILLMGIMAGVAMPRFADSLSNRRVDVAARRLVFDIQATRQQSRITAQATSVAFSIGTNSYTLTGVPDPNRSALPNSVVSLNEGLLRATLGTVNLAGGGTTISFNGFGYPDRGGTITLTSGGATKQVVVDVATGLATVQ